MKATRARSGYAMLLVLVFLVLFLSLVGLAFRQAASVLRIESVRSLQIQRDEGSLHALARGLALLETGFPPFEPYTCAVSIETSNGERFFTVTFASDGGDNWSVHAAPTQLHENPQPMPDTFTPAAN